MNEIFSDLHKIVEGQRDIMFAAELYIWAHPETGFREWQTHSYLIKEFQKLGYSTVPAGEIPGFYADLETGRPGPTVLLMGELDSVICTTHPESDPISGAVHACGHHAQCASLLGAAAAMRDEALLGRLSGRIRFMAVPAEELIELGYRETLRQAGVIKYFGGKPEFMRRGFMDGVDAAIMMHTGGGNGVFGLSPGCNGCITKEFTFSGRAAHAGGAPQHGINALYAMQAALNAVNALRETFPDEDHVRFHPIVTSAGGAVNVIPEKVTMESFVRGATYEAFMRENNKINRALACSTAAIGAGLHLTDRPGYMPVDNDKNMYALCKDVMTSLVGDENVHEHRNWDTGCTDMGDVSCVIPAIHPSSSGAQGMGHGADYKIADRESACTLAAKFLAGTACALLENDGEKAKYVAAHANVKFKSFDEYFKVMDSMFLDLDAVEYIDGGVKIRYK